MATSSENRVFVPTDLLYLLTFTAGMAAFWISGKAPVLLPHLQPRSLAIAAGMTVTAGVYGLGMLALALLVTRRLGRAALIATVIAIVLGIGAAQAISQLAAGHIHNRTDVAVATFALYLCYGAIYALALAIGRKFAR